MFRAQKMSGVQCTVYSDIAVLPSTHVRAPMSCSDDTACRTTASAGGSTAFPRKAEMSPAFVPPVSSLTCSRKQHARLAERTTGLHVAELYCVTTIEVAMDAVG